MPRTKSPGPKPAPAEPGSDDGSVTISLRIPPALLAAIDECVARKNAKSRWTKINRSEWIREALVVIVDSAQAVANPKPLPRGLEAFMKLPELLAKGGEAGEIAERINKDLETLLALADGRKAP